MKQLLSAKEAAIIAAKALDSKKAQNLMLLEVRGVTTLTEYMLLATGTSDTHLRALCDEVEKKMEEAGERVWHREGYRGDTWIGISVRHHKERTGREYGRSIARHHTHVQCRIERR